MSMLYFHCHIVISSSLKYAVFIISYVALYHFQPKITIGTFHIFVRQNCTHLTIFVRFYLLYFDQSVQKKQSQRFALQELLKQFLVMSRHTTAISYQLKYPSALLCLRIHLHFCPITHYKAVCRNTQAGIHRFAVIRKQE